MESRLAAGNSGTEGPLGVGPVTSIKSCNTLSNAEQRFRNAINKGIRDIINFDGFKVGRYELKASQVSKRVLKIVVPEGGAPSQSLLKWAEERGRLNNVTIVIEKVGS